MFLFSLLCSFVDPASSSLTELVSDPFFEFVVLDFFVDDGTDGWITSSNVGQSLSLP
jgi:hypothetical protein